MSIGGVRGSRRIAASLKIGRSTVQKVMRRENLRAIQPKSFKPQTTDSTHGLPICANVLQNGANAPKNSGQVLVGDITYLRLANGKFCYLACLQDALYAPDCWLESCGEDDGAISN